MDSIDLRLVKSENLIYKYILCSNDSHAHFHHDDGIKFLKTKTQPILHEKYCKFST